MRELVLESYGKVNLGLDVLYKRDDGYHELNTIMQQISLKDIITIKNNKKGIIIESNNKDLPLDSTNLVYRAWKKLKEKTGIDRGIHVNIYKNIPLAAGLAGGSSNAAAILKGLNQLWKLGLRDKDLRIIGKELGADVPYCIGGGTALAEGIGEKLLKLKSFKGKNILLVNPGIFISTEDVYSKLDLENQKRINIKKILEAIEDDNLKTLSENMGNVMEKVVINENPIIGEIKDDMMEYGSLGSLMSGSGPTVFGFFHDEDKLDYCEKKLKKKYNKGLVIKAKTI